MVSSDSADCINLTEPSVRLFGPTLPIKCPPSFDCQICLTASIYSMGGSPHSLYSSLGSVVEKHRLLLAVACILAFFSTTMCLALEMCLVDWALWLTFDWLCILFVFFDVYWSIMASYTVWVCSFPKDQRFPLMKCQPDISGWVIHNI